MTKTAPTSNLAKIRLALWALVVIAGVVATVIFVVNPPQRPVGVFGGDFNLQSTAGGTFTQDDLKGTPSLIFFGYTFCPDVCPTTLAETAMWMQTLDLTAEDLRIIFVTVDPERDTVEALKAYLEIFDTPAIGLTGTVDEVENAKKAFGVYSAKVDDGSSTEYLVDHTASVFMMDAEGQYVSTISYGEQTETALGKIRRLLGRE